MPITFCTFNANNLFRDCQSSYRWQLCESRGCGLVWRCRGYQVRASLPRVRG
jgi:hypothetical protein